MLLQTPWVELAIFRTVHGLFNKSHVLLCLRQLCISSLPPPQSDTTHCIHMPSELHPIARKWEKRLCQLPHIYLLFWEHMFFNCTHKNFIRKWNWSWHCHMHSQKKPESNVYNWKVVVICNKEDYYCIQLQLAVDICPWYDNPTSTLSVGQV